MIQSKPKSLQSGRERAAREKEAREKARKRLLYAYLLTSRGAFRQASLGTARSAFARSSAPPPIREARATTRAFNKSAGVARLGPRADRKSKTCSFHGDTLVLTETGMVPIRDIRVGEHRVWAMDEYTGETGWKDVLAHYSNEYDEAVYVRIFDPDSGQTQTIISNRIHPFFGQAPDDQSSLLMVNHIREPVFAFEGGWIEAADLTSGTKLISSDGTWDEVVGVSLETQGVTAFNLTVGEFHTFYVGSSASQTAIWVHNDCISLVRKFNDAAQSRVAVSSLSKSIHEGQQGKHIQGHRNFIPTRSFLNVGVNPTELLAGVHSGRFQVVGMNSRNKPVVDFRTTIGVDASTGLKTRYGVIHSGNGGAHIVPHNPNIQFNH